MKLDYWINEMEKINESGIKDMTKIAKKYKKAEIWTHIDKDGVASGIAMKEYLKQYQIKTVDVHPIQYGSREYAVPKGRPDTLKVLCDFAHGKVMFHIHQDHHEGQVGVDPKTATSFKKKPSGAGIISGDISPRQIFPAEDLKIIDTVDSADFANQGITPDDVIRASFGVNKELSVKDNKWMMGLVVNKLLLTYKNKPNFIRDLVMNAGPSLISMYNVIRRLAKQEGFVPPAEIDVQSQKYQEEQKSKIKPGKLADVKNLKSGESMLLGNLIVQNSGGYMGKGRVYDRYTPFKLHPSANYYTIAWTGVGLIQLSKNPFKQIEKDLHMGNIVMGDVMPKFKSKLQGIDITLETLKYNFEIDITKKGLENTVGFTFKDFIALYGNAIKKLPIEGSYRSLIEDITNKPFKDLSPKQKEIMKKVTVTAWDVIMAGSGGHKNITNLSGLNFIKKNQYSGGYVQLVRDIQYEIAKRMQHE